MDKIKHKDEISVISGRQVALHWWRIWLWKWLHRLGNTSDNHYQYN